MTYRDPDKLRKDKLVGSMAEVLFETLHQQDLGCQVYRTGTEFLYPHLYELMKLTKNQHHHYRGAKFEDLTELKKIAPSFPEDVLKKLIESKRFSQKLIEKELYSAPDFTIITRAGIIIQFEVKYRANGNLEREYIKRYARNHPFSCIFLFMDKPPYMRIWAPRIEDFYTREVMRLWQIASMITKNGVPANRKPIEQSFLELFPPPDEMPEEDVISGLSDMDLNDLIEQIAYYRARINGNYQIIEPDTNGEIQLNMSALKSDVLVYPKELIDKYAQLIKNWLAEPHTKS